MFQIRLEHITPNYIFETDIFICVKWCKDMAGTICPNILYVLTLPEHMFLGVWISVAKIAKT